MARPQNVQDFISNFAYQAQAVARVWDLPASVIIAQSGVESLWGKKAPGNAYFGVKANSSYYECKAKIAFQTTEVQPGLSGVHNFCAYGTYFDAAVGYAKFISDSPQFATALTHRKDPFKYAAGVADGGYAGGTDKKQREAYKALLHQVMRDFDLLELDRVVYLEPITIVGSKK
jgi:flagellum-specific peptidoglycan hydrolase FlgJ